MWFWIVMFFCNLMLPAFMLGFGVVMERHTPKEINGVYGYRTPMSTKNMLTWNYAHAVCGRLWQRVGMVMLPVSAAVQLPFIKSSENTVGIMTGVLCALQCAALFATIFFVERALKKKFNRDGSLKQPRGGHDFI